MKLSFKEETFDVVTVFVTIYFWLDIKKSFKQIYTIMKSEGTFMICNEVNGENEKDKK